MDDDRTQLEVYELADALIRGDITAEEADRLARLVERGEEARTHYLRFMHDSAKLCRWSIVWRNSRGEADGEWAKSPPARGLRALGFLDSAWDDTIRLLSQEVGLRSCLSYLIAFALFGLLLLAAISLGRTDPMGVAAASRPPAVPGEREKRPWLVIVGRVTWVHDCRCWVDRATMTKDIMAVPLGRSIYVVRGMMEITYDTGAKVLLRSPCKYRVISANSGFLLCGNVTALVENGAGAKDNREDGLHLNDPASVSLVEPTQGPQAAHPLCFIIRTPNAMLASQGGEFTVGVDEEGQTRGLALWGPLKTVTLGRTESRYVNVLHGSNNFRAGLDNGKCCLLELNDTHSHGPYSSSEDKRRQRWFRGS